MRQARKIIARVFAGQVGLSPGEYAEVEAGVVRWVHEKQEHLISVLLDMDGDAIAKFNYLLSQAREAGSLRFDDVFTREQLSPSRLCGCRTNL